MAQAPRLTRQLKPTGTRRIGKSPLPTLVGPLASFKVPLVPRGVPVLSPTSVGVGALAGDDMDAFHLDQSLCGAVVRVLYVLGWSP